MRIPLATVILVSATMHTYAYAQSATKSSGPPSGATAVQQLRDVELRWGQAFTRRDSASLAPLIHQDFVGVYPNRWYAKQDFLNMAAAQTAAGARALTGSVADPDKFIRVYGSTAVVIGTAIYEYREPDGSKSVVRTAYTETFVWEDGRWQCVSGHYSPVYSPEIPKKWPR